MKYVLSVTTAAALLTAFAVQSVSAQVSTLTNADVVRFVALKFSDQEVLNLVNDATVAGATRFDLSPAAVADLVGHGVPALVIAAMRQPPAPRPRPTTPPRPGPEVYTCASAPLSQRPEDRAREHDPLQTVYSPLSSPAEIANIDRSKLDGIINAAVSLRLTEWTAGPEKIDALLLAFDTSRSNLCRKALPLTRGEKNVLDTLESSQEFFKLGFGLMRLPGGAVRGYAHLQDARDQVDFVISTFISKK